VRLGSRADVQVETGRPTDTAGDDNKTDGSSVTQIFPKWTNRLPLYAAVGAVVLAVSAVGAVWYYGSPWYTDVGYRPIQPVAYSHKLHAGDLGIDCRYCHTDVERSAVASVPPTQTCMNCHKLILPDSASLQPVRDSWVSGIPLQWVRVHKIPDYAYFDHGAHVTRGVGCISCHGNVTQMDVVRQVKPLSMSWCLDCHRNPERHLRPVDEVTNMDWTPGDDHHVFVADFTRTHGVLPPTDCSGCHR